ncbi:MAG: tyrosine-type recombinase/integrase [Nitrospiria bacterium]
MPTKRGEGWVFQRGRIWWIQYCHRGKVFRESSGSENEEVVRKLLRKRLDEITDGRFKDPKVERTRFEELAQDILNDYKINGRKSLHKVKLTLSHLSTEFERDRMVDITSDRIMGYIVRRQEEGAANATVNRELATLKRMFSLGLRYGKVAIKPYIPTLQEDNIRQGFFEWDDFARLRKHLPDYLRPVVTFAYYTGWRSGEIRSLRWKQVDLKAGYVRLEPGTTKNRKGRSVYLAQELQDLLSDLWKRRRLDCQWVFNREGNFIAGFRRAWDTACKKTGLTGMVFHDFRRTAVRNMVRASVSQNVAMEISGHKTPSVFKRYDIVSESDLKEAALRVEAFAKTQRQDTAKILPFQAEKVAH